MSTCSSSSSPSDPSPYRSPQPRLLNPCGGAGELPRVGGVGVPLGLNGVSRPGDVSYRQFRLRLPIRFGTVAVSLFPHQPVLLQTAFAAARQQRLVSWTARWHRRSHIPATVPVASLSLPWDCELRLEELVDVVTGRPLVVSGFTARIPVGHPVPF